MLALEIGFQVPILILEFGLVANNILQVFGPLFREPFKILYPDIELVHRLRREKQFNVIDSPVLVYRTNVSRIVAFQRLELSFKIPDCTARVRDISSQPSLLIAELLDELPFNVDLLLKLVDIDQR
jgi:hypothetical protein